MPADPQPGDPFEALGDANRRAIVELLRPGPLSVAEISRRMPISQPAVSRHLRLLKQARLVTDEARGARRMYFLSDEGADAVRAYMEQVWGDVAGRFRLTADNTRPAPGGPAMTDPLRLGFDVACGPEHAFTTWTERVSMWWPADHTVSRRPDVDVVFEAAEGGRIFERSPTGDEIDWGSILAWEPPNRVVYRWHLMFDPADATEVEVSFVGRSDGTTRVAIEHRGWDAFGDAGRLRRERNQAGWAGVVPRFAAACRTGG